MMGVVYVININNIDTYSHDVSRHGFHLFSSLHSASLATIRYLPLLADYFFFLPATCNHTPTTFKSLQLPSITTWTCFLFGWSEVRFITRNNFMIILKNNRNNSIIIG